MTLEEIYDMAKTYEKSMLAHNMTKMELVCLLGLINKRMDSRLLDPTTPPTPEIKTSVEKPTPQPHKGIKYDGLYDPPPPMDIDKPPERTSTSRIIAKANQVCVCNACRAHVYTVNRDIPETSKIPEFIASFTPMPGEKPIDKTTEIMNEDGSISMDCPHCHSSKTLFLTGKATL